MVVVHVDVGVVIDVLLESFKTLQTHNIVRKSNLKEAIFLTGSCQPSDCGLCRDGDGYL